MPLITITSLKGSSAERKQKIGEAVHAAFLDTDIMSLQNYFQRFLELDPEAFLNNRYYPSQKKIHSRKFVIIEILFSFDDSIKAKRKFLESLISKLNEESFNAEDVFVSFHEISWKNWSFSNG